MLSAIITDFKKFRDSLYNIFSRRADASMELIDAISSNQSANSVVELSQGPLFRRKYSSITDAISSLSILEDGQKFQKLLITQCETPSEIRPFNLFILDATPQQRKFSKVVNDRGYIHYPNPVAGNAPVTIGHQYSLVAYSPEKQSHTPPWLLPLNIMRIPTCQTPNSIAIEQLKQTITDNKFKDQLNVTCMDSAYSVPEFIENTYKIKNSVIICRLRNNRTVYRAPLQKKVKGYGQNLTYGAEIKLNKPDTHVIPDNTISYIETMANGKKFNICIDTWFDIMFRQKNNIPLHKYSFTMLKITVTNADTGELIFKRPLWLMVAGVCRKQLSAEQIYKSYRTRYDIEHFFRFGKQRLLLDKSQTPDTKHEEHWWQLATLAYAQLFLARDISKKICSPWEKYLPNKQKNIPCSPAEVQKYFIKLASEIGTPAKPPKIRGSSLGRIKGQVQIKRIRHAIVKKAQGPPKKAAA